MNNELEVFVFNVGQGDNILIKFSTGTYGLIDFYFDSDQTEPPSLTYLKNLKGDIIIEFLHVTHYHQDHTKGLDRVFSWINEKKGIVQLKYIWLPGMIPPEKFKKMLDKIRFVQSNASKVAKEGKSAEVNDVCFKFKYLDIVIEKFTNTGSIIYMLGCQPYPVNNKYTVLCIAPSAIKINMVLTTYFSHMEKIFMSIFKKKMSIDENSLSTILFLNYITSESTRLMLAFGGDATKSDWLKAIEDFNIKKPAFNNAWQELHSSFIKVSHHGSSYSSDSRIWHSLIEPLKDEEIQLFISAGNQEHPHDETLEHIKAAAESKNRIISLHITNRINEKYNYKENTDSFRPVLRGEANKRADELYRGSRTKKSRKDHFGYKYIHNVVTGESRVEKLK